MPTNTTPPNSKGFRFPSEISSHAVWLLQHNLSWCVWVPTFFPPIFPAKQERQNRRQLLQLLHLLIRLHSFTHTPETTVAMQQIQRRTSTFNAHTHWSQRIFRQQRASLLRIGHMRHSYLFYKIVIIFALTS